jgi:hypothetical protein
VSVQVVDPLDRLGAEFIVDPGFFKIVAISVVTHILPTDVIYDFHAQDVSK